MPALMPHKLPTISKASAADPKAALLDALGDSISKITIMGSRLLVATYISPDKSAGGIIIPDKSKMEDLWQGCLGLVLQKGPSAFIDDDLHKFYGTDVEVGQWVLFRFASAWEQTLNGVSVRLVADTEIQAVVVDPKIVTIR